MFSLTKGRVIKLPNFRQRTKDIGLYLSAYSHRRRQYFLRHCVNYMHILVSRFILSVSFRSYLSGTIIVVKNRNGKYVFRHCWPRDRSLLLTVTRFGFQIMRVISVVKPCIWHLRLWYVLFDHHRHCSSSTVMVPYFLLAPFLVKLSRSVI